MVQLGGFEPPTSGSTIRRSNQLSYNCTSGAAEIMGRRGQMQAAPPCGAAGGGPQTLHHEVPMSELEIAAGKTPLSLWRAIARGGHTVVLAPPAWGAIARARATIEQALDSGRAIYGVNTGFGKLAQTRILPDELKLLQRNLVLSHAAGVGPPLEDEIVRLALALKIASLARGHSGVRAIVVERLLDCSIMMCCRRSPSRAPWERRETSRRSPISAPC